MAELGESSLIVQVGTKKVLAHFEKIQSGTFEYESEESPMPARFRETWRITITYPVDIVPNEED
jgi:hypothetical protein